MDTNILLESGTNELQLLEFFVGKKSFGINIAKVSEMMSYCPVTPMPQTNEAIEGIFMPRDKIITVVDLHKILNIPLEEGNEGMFIVCEFNTIHVAFHVSSVSGMRRISWTNIEKPPTVAQDEHAGLVTGIAKLNDKMILVLDFEKIVADLNQSAGLDTEGIEDASKHSDVDFTKHIVIAEDSPLLNKMIMDALHTTGFKNIMSFTNGADAWSYIQNFRQLGDNVLDEVSLLITDIEMPQMDGHRLTKLIKEDKVLSKIPVFLFSSLIDDMMRKKGESVGADEQFSKPQMGQLVDALFAYCKR